MRKTFLKVSILAAIGVAMSASFTSCKDYDDDINNLQTQVDALKQSISTLEGKINAGAVITGVSTIDNGYRFTLSDGKTYDITNGKDGANGKDGESNLWTIVKDAEGKLVWALNGVATEYPAQGPAGENGKPGENGESLPGIYYKPGENGYWIEVNPADGTEKETTIAWKPAATESLYAVVDNDKVVIYNFTDENGDTIDPVTIWKSSFIKSLVVKPELYLDGIESVRYGVAVQKNLLKSVKATADVPVATPNGVAGATATILRGEIYKTSDADLVNNKVPQFLATELAKITYAANPSNAVLGNTNWNLIFDDIEVASRSSEVVGEVTVAPTAVDKDGNITLTYQLTNNAGYGLLKPNSIYKTNAAGQWVDENGNVVDDPTVYEGPESEWTFMAIQAINKTDNNSVVTSDNAAVLKQWVAFNNLIVKDNADFSAKVALAKEAEDAIKDSEKDNMNDVVIPAPYNAVLNLNDWIAIDIEKMTPMLSKLAGSDKLTSQDTNMNDVQGTPGVMSLKEAAEKWNLTPTYTLVNYTVGSNQTSESKFAKLDGSIVTPQWVGTDGSQNNATTGDGGRSAIGRRPLVYVTLNNAEGKVVLAGFVKIEWTQPAITDQPIVLQDIRVPYICEYTDGTDWETVSGGIYEKLGYTAQEFINNFEMEKNTVYVLENGQYIQTLGNSNYYNGTANYGEFEWIVDESQIKPDGSFTQGLFFTVDKSNYISWYPRINPATGKYWTKEEFVTTEPVTKTLYAKFSSTNFHQIVYIGFNVTVVGAPAATYDGKIFSSWSQNYTVTPVNPAVPTQTTTGVYGNANNNYSYAQVMGMNFTSAWKGGDPTITGTDNAYLWVSDYTTQPYYAVDEITANYRFADEQPEYTGLSGAKYAIKRNGKIGSNNDVHALYAYKYDANGNVDVTKNGQPIAVINANNAIRNELGGNAGTLGSTNNKGGVWNRIDFLSVYKVAASGEVIAPSNGAATGFNYGEFACDIINANAYDRNNPPVTLNVEMVVTYSQNGKTCVLTVPAVESFKVGAGRPLSIDKEKEATIQDASQDNNSVLASKLFQVVDWQDHALWKVENGAVKANSIYGDFWMSLGDYKAVQWSSALTNSSFVINLAEATVGDGKTNLGKFVDVYTDKHISFVKASTASNVSVNNAGDVATITNWTDLDDLSIKWVNNGNSVTEKIFISIPVYINYIWGKNVFLGNAVLTIEPTLQAGN